MKVIHNIVSRKYRVHLIQMGDHVSARVDFFDPLCPVNADECVRDGYTWNNEKYAFEAYPPKGKRDWRKIIEEQLRKAHAYGSDRVRRDLETEARLKHEEINLRQIAVDVAPVGVVEGLHA